MYNFYFLSFSSFSNQFWLEMNPQWYFLIFQIFLEFSSTRLVGTKRNETIIFIFHISHPFPTYFGLKWTIIVFIFFSFDFFTIFREFSITHRVETKQNDNFLFSIFLSLFQPILAWNEARMVFFNFFNFFAIFFLIFYYPWVRNGTER